MSSYGGKELASAFRTVRKNTIQVAEDIPEAQYGHVAGPECKSVAGMLAHIAVSTQIWEEIHKKQRMTTLVGLDYFGIRGRMDADETKPRSKAELVAWLRASGEEFAGWLETLTPEFLAEMVTEPDGKTAKSRSMRCRSFLGWMMKNPSIPSAICSVSSACGWYICVPLWRSVNS